MQPLLLSLTDGQREAGIGVKGYEAGRACLPGKPGGRLLVAPRPVQVVAGNKVIGIAIVVVVAGQQKTGQLPLNEGRQLLKKGLPLQGIATVGRQVTQPYAKVNRPVGLLSYKQGEGIPAALAVAPSGKKEAVGLHASYALL